jgi:hypothetical protein
MRPTLIDLNDVELRIARGSDELARSPGYATLVNQKVEIGDSGFAHAWLLPRQSNNRYWQALNTTPVTQLGKRVRHAGDLAYLHLEHLRERGGRPDQAIFIVPACYQRTQLSLLLGIAQAAGLAIDALVDSAVAVGAALAPGTYTIVEALLHQATITQIAVDQQRAVLLQTEIVPEAGHTHFEQRIIGCIVEAFLKDCRFDPLHDAATEQLLHTHLAQWLALLGERPEIAVSIEYHGARHEARLQRGAIAAAIAPLRLSLAQRAGHGSILLDYRLARLPGITLDWPGAQPLPANAALTGCADSPDLQNITGQAVGLRRELAIVPATSRAAPAIPPRAAHTGATHLLVQHLAYPLTHIPLHLTARGTVQRAVAPDTVANVSLDAGGSKVEVTPDAGVLLNGQRIVGSARLSPGDHLTIAGATSLFVPIAVQGNDAF